MTFKDGAGVLEVLLSVGFRGGDALERFVEDAGDSLLFGEWGAKSGKLSISVLLIEAKTAPSRPPISGWRFNR